MFSWLTRKARAIPVPTAAGGDPPPLRRLQEVSAVAYPPRDPGLPVADVATLVQDQADLLRELRTHAALGDGQFRTRFEGPVERLAAYVNTLPGSANGAFAGAGGLLRAAIEGAFAIFRASDGRIFTGELGVEDRHLREPRWRYICFLAGLLYPVGAPLNALHVVDEEGHTWSHTLQPLAAWAAAARRSRIYVAWTTETAEPGPAPCTATFALQIAGVENIEWLNAGSPMLVQALLDVVSGSAGRDSLVGQLVRDMWPAIRDRELGRNPQHYGQLTIGADIAPYLIDAIVCEFKAKWRLNEDVAYADRQGIYLEWPRAGQDIRAFCKAQGYVGVPVSDAALLAMLVGTRIIESEGEGLALTSIADAAGEVVTAVKLASPGLLLEADQTLDAVAAGRPVRMAAVRAADPLGQPSSAQGTMQGAVSPPTASMDLVAVPKPAPSLAVVDDAELAAIAGEQDDDEPDLDVPSAAPTPSSSQAGAPPKPAAPEGREVKFRDMLPSDVQEQLSMVDAEYLGRLLHTWKTRKGKAPLMRLCEHGAAFEMDVIKDVRDPPKFLVSLAERGLLYTAASTPKKLFYKVPVAEGSQSTKDCFILAHVAVRKLGLQ